MKIFILHKGRQPHIKYILEELLKKNSSEDIVFFTDDKKSSAEYFGYDILYENISDYFDSSSKFEKIYVHKSKNPFKYELICIQRWLVFLEYMEKHNINDCRQIDSDVLIFCDLKDYANRYLKDYNFCCVASSGGTFYGNKKGLSEFKKFLFDTYKNRLETLDGFYKKKWYPIYPRNNGFIEHEKTWCVSDITLFYLFIKEKINGVKYKDIGMICNNTVFDDNINRGVGFVHNKFLKKVKIIGNYYYGKLEKKDIQIFFNCLHFQGNSKSLIKYYQERNLGIKYIYTVYWTRLFYPFIFYILNKLKIDILVIKVYQKIRKSFFGETSVLIE